MVSLTKATETNKKMRLLFLSPSTSPSPIHSSPSSSLHFPIPAFSGWVGRSPLPIYASYPLITLLLLFSEFTMTNTIIQPSGVYSTHPLLWPAHTRGCVSELFPGKSSPWGPEIRNAFRTCGGTSLSGWLGFPWFSSLDLSDPKDIFRAHLWSWLFLYCGQWPCCWDPPWNIPGPCSCSKSRSLLSFLYPV